MSFIYDYSRWRWVYFLRNKFEVFSQFKEFKALMENKASMKNKMLRIGNVGEIFSIDIDKFCKENSIELHKKNPYTHQHNRDS